MGCYADDFIVWTDGNEGTDVFTVPECKIRLLDNKGKVLFEAPEQK